ncbi:polysaccharide biosynthesis/export family protein [uncultured Mucilaginibacter sp.]|uniref:polysaccharide biosynthesis/export family protein n=1 Tax=uncultured Mucilaginibacter sp. TaxID=797541 RepID=UPI00260B568B|nr:polysaccharide biosynthesis/export family protein [uncultured Mucilaginibacter sp.]
MNKINNFYYIFLTLLLSSCSSYKNIPYFQDLNHTKPTKEQVENYSPLTIQPADVLSINVSSRNPESSAIFSSVNGNNSNNSPDNQSIGYLVDQKGNIHLPLIGNLKVAGLTTNELREKLNQTLLTYYKDPVVNIRLLNLKVSVFGDVLRPNIYTLPNERTTLTQALSLAGDLNITAMRNNIILIREEDGKRNYIPLDLTSKKLFESPYYYIKNNDEIYVQPDRTKYATVDRGNRTATFVLSGISVLAILLTYLRR